MIIWSPGVSLEDMEEKIIEKAYDHYGKNAEKTASSLKIPMDILNEKIKKFSEKQREINKMLDLEKKKYEDYLRRARGQTQKEELTKDLMRKQYEQKENIDNKKRKFLE